MKIKHLLPLILIAILAVTACKKSGQTPANGNSLSVDVYACGYVFDGFLDGYAALWKNGVIQKLSDNPSYAFAIAHYNKDIYVAGYENNTACYWKNGKLILLDGADRSSARAIAIHGGDVYISGWTEENGEDQAVFWKNGIMTKLSSNAPYSFASGIAIQGSDIYICGAYYTSRFKTFSCYWKNGLLIPLTDSTYSSAAKGIVINGKDVQVALNINNRAAYWKNGAITKLTTEVTSLANGIVLNNNDVYISGGDVDSTSYISYWKNGKGVTVSNLPSSSSIAVNGDDLYLGGGYNNGTDNFAAYWKNGNLVRLEQTTISYVTGIALVPK